MKQDRKWYFLLFSSIFNIPLFKLNPNSIPLPSPVSLGECVCEDGILASSCWLPLATSPEMVRKSDKSDRDSLSYQIQSFPKYQIIWMNPQEIDWIRYELLWDIFYFRGLYYFYFWLLLSYNYIHFFTVYFTSFNLIYFYILISLHIYMFVFLIS